MSKSLILLMSRFEKVSFFLTYFLEKGLKMTFSLTFSDQKPVEKLCSKCKKPTPYPGGFHKSKSTCIPCRLGEESNRYRADPGYRVAVSLDRSKAVERATPACADRRLIKQLHVYVRRLNKLLGGSVYSLDHHYPIGTTEDQTKEGMVAVVGLNTPENLYVLERSANISKKRDVTDPTGSPAMYDVGFIRQLLSSRFSVSTILEMYRVENPQAVIKKLEKICGLQAG